MGPHTPVANLPGIGKYYSYKLKRLDIKTVENLIYHFPFRYDDFSKIATIQNLTSGEKLSVQGVVWKIENVRTFRGKFLTKATVADQSGTIEVIWFNQPFLTKVIRAGIQISLAGKVQLDGNRPKLVSPSYEIIRTSQLSTFTSQLSTIHTGRFVPVYPETEGVTSKWLRARIASLLPIYLKTQTDFLPEEIIKSEKLEKLTASLYKIHFPKNYQEVNEARKRLAFDELFLTQLMAISRKKKWQKSKKYCILGRGATIH